MNWDGPKYTFYDLIFPSFRKNDSQFALGLTSWWICVSIVKAEVQGSGSAMLGLHPLWTDPESHLSIVLPGAQSEKVSRIG